MGVQDGDTCQTGRWAEEATAAFASGRGLWAEAKHIKHTLSKSQDQMWRRSWSQGEQGAGLREKHAVCAIP